MADLPEGVSTGRRLHDRTGTQSKYSGEISSISIFGKGSIEIGKNEVCGVFLSAMMCYEIISSKADTGMQRTHLRQI
jgi:hypothetical protein